MYRLDSYNKLFANAYAQHGMFGVILRNLGFSERLILLLKERYLEPFLDELELLLPRNKPADVVEIEIALMEAASNVLRQNGYEKELPARINQ